MSCGCRVWMLGEMTMFASARANDAADYSKFMSHRLNHMKTADVNRISASPLVDSPFAPKIADKEEERAPQKLLASDNNMPLGLSALGVALLTLAGLLGVRMRRGVQSAADLAMPMAQASVDNILELKAQQSSGSAHRKQNLRPLTALYATADSEEATAVNDEAAGEQATNDEPAPVAPPPAAKWSIEKDMPAGISAPFGLFDPAE